MASSFAGEPLSDATSNLSQLRALLLTGPAPEWQPGVGPSTAGPSSGDGVFLQGTCEAGTVLLVYPGVSFQAEDLPVMHQVTLWLEPKHCLDHPMPLSPAPPFPPLPRRIFPDPWLEPRGGS